MRGHGIITAWNTDRGFGFIRRDDGARDLFCHAKDLPYGMGALEVGQPVRFNISAHRDGRERASDVELAR